MATDPTALIQQLVNAGGNFSQSFQGGQQQALQTAGAQQQLQAGALQLAAVQQKAQQAQQYQQDVEGYFKDPSPQNLANLAVKYPQQAEGLKQSYSIMAAPQKESRIAVLGGIYDAAKNGRADLVASQMDNVIQAEKRAGIDTSDAESLKASIAAGDKDALTRAQAFAQMHLAAADPDFAKAVGVTDSGKDKTHVINPGGALVDDAGRELYRATDKVERPVEVPVYDDSGRRIGTRLVAVGGAPSGGNGPAPAGRTVGGWTPRIANGGDNSDASVDNKIAGVANALGVDPTADISTLSPLQIAKALSFGEGGSGTLADRNNNPTNLRNGDGSYKKFSSPDASYSAAAALVARKLKAGQTSVKTLIEGLPSGGAGADPNYIGPEGGASSSAAIKPGDLTTVPQSIRASVQAIADGRSSPPRPGSRNGEALLDAVTAYDPTFDASNAQSRVKTRVDFTSGKSAQNITAMNTAMGHLLHLDDLAHDLGNFSTLPGLLNPIYNSARAAAGNTTLGQFEQTKQAASSELRKVFAGQSGGNLEELRQFEGNLSSSKSPEQLHAVVANAVELLGSRLNALQDQYAQGMGRSDHIPTFIKPSLARQAAARFGVDLGSGKQAAAQTAAPAAPVQVSTRAQAMALPPGTKFLDPNGVLRTRP